MDYSNPKRLKRFKSSIFLALFSFLILAIVASSIRLNVFAAPDDGFAEHGKHFPWNAGEVYVMTSGYNEAPFHNNWNTKYLLDFDSPDKETGGDPVRVVGDGTVIAVQDGYNEGAGRYIKVDHGQGFMTRYDHLDEFMVNVGDVVTRGQQIAKIGFTGKTNGASHIQVSLWKDGVMVPLEHMLPVEGLNETNGDSPVGNLDNKNWDRFRSLNYDAVPSNPELLSAEVQSCVVKLTWNPAKNAHDYSIVRKDEGMEPKEIYYVGGDQTFYPDNTANAGKTYEYQIQANNNFEGGSSSLSNMIAVQMPADCDNLSPPAPVLESAIPETCNIVNLTWSDVEGEIGYKVFRDDNLLTSSNPNVTSFKDGWAFEDTTHKYSVQAIGPGGSSDSNVIEVKTPLCENQPKSAQDGGPQAGEKYFSDQHQSGEVDDPVNAYSGNYYTTQTDLSVNSVGIPVEFSRTYNSSDRRISSLGQGWQFAYDIYLLNTFENEFAVKLPNGSADYYKFEGDEFVPVFPETVATLKDIGEGVEYEKPDGTKYRFDMNGFVYEIEDRNGNIMKFNYNGDFLLSEITDTAGRTYQLEHEEGRLKTITDPAGRTVTYTYDDNKQLVSVTSPAGRVWQYAYNEDFKMISQTDPNGGTTSFTYDGDGEKVIGITHPDGGSVSFDYQDGQTVQTDERGGKITFVHDDQGRMVEMIDQLGQKETYAYDEKGNMTTYNDRNGHTTTYVYDEFGNILSSTRANGYKQELTYGPFNQPTHIKDQYGEVTMDYDDDGNLLKRTDALGNAVTFTYNDQGLPLTFTSPLNQTLTYEYDGESNLIKLINVKGGETEFDYDAISRRTQVTDALEHEADFAYDPDSLVTTLTDPNGGTQVYGYDGNENLKEITNEIGAKSLMAYTPLNQLKTNQDFEGNTVTYEYDVDGLPIAEIDARGFKTTNEYDAAGRKIKTILPEGGTILYTYDGNDLIKTITDPNGNVTTFDYTSTGAVSKVNNAAGDTMTYERDLLDRVIKMTDWNGNVREYNYDALGRLEGEKTPVGGQVTYSYDAASNRLSMTDPLGRVTSYSYDEANQLIEVTDAEGGKTTMIYDPVGNLTEQIDANGHSQKFTYDPATNLLEMFDGEGNKTAYAYDPRNLLETLTDPNGHATNFEYDANGMLLKKTNAKGDSFQYEYDAASNLIKTLDEIGAANTYNYDGQNRLKEHQTALGFKETFGYDLASNLTAHTDFNGNTTQFAYDPLNRLSKKTDALGGIFETQYDGNSNILAEIDALGKTTAYSYNALDQLNKVTNALGHSRTLSYNVAGELTAETDFRGNDTNYLYDDLSRLIKVTNARDYATQYAYDAVGNLKLVTDANGYETAYDYDKADRLLEVQKPEEVLEKFEYDPAGNLLAFINGEEGKTSYTYDPLNQVIKETSPLGHQTTLEYTPVGLQQKLTDANGHATSYEYDLDRRLIKETDPRQNSLLYAYDPNSNLTKTTDKRGFEMLNSYDALNRLVTAKDEAGFEEKFGYDAVSNMLSQINRRGFETKYTYDAIHQKVATTDAKGATETYVYDPDGNRTLFTDRDSNKTAFEYDAMSNMTKITDALNGLQTFTYDPVDQLLKQLNQNGHPTDYAYDGLGRLVKETDALEGKKLYGYNKKDELMAYKNPRGFEELYQYDADGRLIEWKDQSKNKETYAYDPVGNLLEKIDRRGNPTKYTYNPNDSLETLTDSLNYKWTYTYDQNENRIKLNDARGNDWLWEYEPRNNMSTFKQPEGQVTTYAYDENENLITNTLPRGNAHTYTYDPLDLLETTKDPLGHITKNAYDNVERKVAVTDAKDQTTQYAYDPLYRLVKVTDPLDGVTKYAYDPVGNLLKTTDANNHDTQFEYDPLNRTTKETNPLGSTWKYEYDPNGNMIKRDDANGKTTLYTYNPTDWLTKKTYNMASEAITYGYDPNGNMTNMKDTSGNSDFTFDPLNRLVKQKDGKNNSLSFAYDGNSNRTQITYPNGKNLDYEFSPNNWMTKMTDWQNFGTTFAYDDNKNLVHEVMPNDSQVFYEYDMDDRLTKKINEARGEAMETYQFEYDPVHNIVEETRDYSKLRERGPVEPEHNEIDYTYDPLNRLTEVKDITGKLTNYEYDPVGNRTLEENNRNFELIKNGKGTFNSNTQETIEYEYNAANQLIEDTYFDYKYDKNGNRLEKDKKGSAEHFAYTYNTENQMIKSEHFTQPNKPVTSNYVYDGLTRRVEATVGDGKGNANKGHSTWSVYDGFGFDQLVDFPEPNKEVQLRRTDDGRLLSFEVFSGVTPKGNKQPVQQGRYGYLQTNHRFDTTQVLKFDGQASHSYLYDEFGMLYSVNKNDNNADNFTDPHNAYTFSGTQWDEETSLNYYGSRYYDSWNGTWSTQDIYRGMIEDPQSLHRSAFVKNNPINFVDPDGFSEEGLINFFSPVINLGKALTPDAELHIPETTISHVTKDGITQQTVSFDWSSKNGEISASGSINATQYNSKGISSAQVQGDAYLGSDPNGNPAYAAGGGCGYMVNGKMVYQCSGSFGNEAGYNQWGNGSSADYNYKTQEEIEADLIKHTKQIKTEANQILIQSAIRQANLQKDKAMEWLKNLFVYGEEIPWYLELAADATEGLEWIHGASFATFDNITMGIFNKWTEFTGTEPVFTENGIEGAKFADWASLQLALAEAGISAYLIADGTKNSGSGLILAIPTSGGSMTLVAIGSAEQLVGIAGAGHSGLMTNYLMNKDYNEYGSSGSGSGGGGKVEQSNTYDLKSTHRIDTNTKPYQNLKQQIVENGIQEPIKYILYNGEKYVVNGHNRLKIAKELGIENVPVQQVDFPYGNYRTPADLFY